MKSMDKEINHEKKEETQLLGRMKTLDKKIASVEKTEKSLDKKEHELEEKEKLLMDHDKAHRRHIEQIEKMKMQSHEDWGEGGHGREHYIEMEPLVPFGGFRSAPPPTPILGFGKVMKDMMKKITKPGKAPEHKKSPIL